VCVGGRRGNQGGVLDISQNRHSTFDSMEILRRLFLSAIIFVCLPGKGVCVSGPPPQAAAVGYFTNTFSSNFTPSTVDLSNTRRLGFKWYLWQFFGQRTTNRRTLEFNPDGSVSLFGDNNSRGGNLATAAPGKNSSKFVGTAFGGGGYFEGILKFNPKSVVRRKGWPAYWSVALEHLVALQSVRWFGQGEGFEHFIEPDFFEYDMPGGGNQYGGAIHEWYGIYNKTCAHFCDILIPNYRRVVPENTDFNQFHKYGFLWVRATPSRRGYAEYYFDDHRVGARTVWVQFKDQPPPSVARSVSPWSFGIIDRQHLVLVLGSGPGEPMTVRSVNVWQYSSSEDMSGF
jgi:hypothetical protein